MRTRDAIRALQFTVRVLSISIALLLFNACLLFHHFYEGQLLSFREGRELQKTITPYADSADILQDDIGKELVVTNCTNCHSARLIVQNRATRDGWIAMIRWMQETQNLWDLGDNEAAIIDYLARNYAPHKKGRRANLEGVEWYELE